MKLRFDFGPEDGLVSVNFQGKPIFFPTVEHRDCWTAGFEAAMKVVHSPEIQDFTVGVAQEASFQRHHWGTSHDAGKTPEDWFWLMGYLLGKVLQALKAGNTDKALHHTISGAAALSNWHAAIRGTSNEMRPGIQPPVELDVNLPEGENTPSSKTPGSE